MIQNKEYPVNTLGYHRQMAEKVFGEGSAPVIWLDEQAERAEAGYDTKANKPEKEIVKHLRALHDREKDDEEKGYVDEDSLEE